MSSPAARYRIGAPGDGLSRVEVTPSPPRGSLDGVDDAAQRERGVQVYEHWNGYPSGGWWFGAVLFLLILLAGVVVVVLLLRGGHRGGGAAPAVFPVGRRQDAAERILAERFATGAIDEAEYRSRLAVLRGDGTDAPSG